MKLKTFNAENASLKRSGKPTIRVNRKSGVLSLSTSALELMDLKQGSEIELSQDEDSPADWYIHKSHSGNGFKIKCRLRNAQIQSTYLARKILDCLKQPDMQSARFLISREPVEIEGLTCWLIITSSGK